MLKFNLKNKICVVTNYRLDIFILKYRKVVTFSIQTSASPVLIQETDSLEV